MSSNYVLSLAGWYFLPNLVTGWLQTIYYRITLRAGDAAPQPGTPQFVKHRRIFYCTVIAAYLLYCIYEADWQLQREGTFYQDLGVGIDVGEKTLQRRLRQISAQLHPDRYPEHQKTVAHDAFIVVKTKADALIDPSRRFAYDRFGPDSTQWKHCKTIQDYVWQGVQNSGALYLGTLMMMVVGHILGFFPHGRYWRFLTLTTLLVFEAHTITRAQPPLLLTHILNPFFITLRVHVPLLPFQILKLARQTALAVFIAVNQLAPVLANPNSPSVNSDEALQPSLNQLRGLVIATSQGTQRLLELEVAPFVQDEREERRLKQQLKDWLVRNEIRNERGVDSAIKNVVEKRNAEARGEHVN